MQLIENPYDENRNPITMFIIRTRREKDFGTNRRDVAKYRRKKAAEPQKRP